jgi:hypothetical protein
MSSVPALLYLWLDVSCRVVPDSADRVRVCTTNSIHCWLPHSCTWLRSSARPCLNYALQFKPSCWLAHICIYCSVHGPV